MGVSQIVIGSGPAGVACAMALLAQGQTVVMIDGGLQLEADRTQRLVTLAATAPQTWSSQSSAWLRDGMQATVEGVPLKLAYGSDFPYRKTPGAPAVEGEGVNTKFSMGKGGLSAVWGAAVMPYRQHDLAGWPITAEDLAPHYRAVLDFMPVAQCRDGLEDLFPTYLDAQSSGSCSGEDAPLPLSAQAAALHAGMHAHAAALRSQGVHFGRSRLAVDRSRCVRCGLCMYGCPYGLIYSTAHTVDALIGRPNFTYSPGFSAQSIEERGDHVLVHTINPQGMPEVLTGDRVFLGAGVLASAPILLRSLQAYDTPITFRESHYFLLPLLRLAGVPGFERGNLHTLAQLFVEVMDQAVSPYTIHLQTYTYNDLFEQAISQKLGPLARLFPWHAFLSRLFLFQGYLHSDHSPLTVGRLQRRGRSDVLTLVPTQRPETATVIRKLIRKLGKLRSMTGMLPLTSLIRPGESGRGFHTGSTFPMAARPSGLESDLIGRPAGLRRTHVIDSSILPSIPATTITYTVMANAHRIGTHVGRGDI